jgi:hypothetical protein
VNGISGCRFQSPFASPPGVGESSPLLNVIWGMVNFAVGYTLLTGVGEFSTGPTLDALTIALGALAAAAGLSVHFGRVRDGNKDGER